MREKFPCASQGNGKGEDPSAPDIGSLDFEELHALRNRVRCTWLRHPRHASYDAGTTYSVFLNRIALHLDELQVSC